MSVSRRAAAAAESQRVSPRTDTRGQLRSLQSHDDGPQTVCPLTAPANLLFMLFITTCQDINWQRIAVFINTALKQQP